MNVQMSPPTTPTGNRPDETEGPSHTRTYVMGGVGLAVWSRPVWVQVPPRRMIARRPRWSTGPNWA